MREYEKPSVTSEDAFETLAAGCTFFTEMDENCNPTFGDDFQPLNS